MAYINRDLEEKIKSASKKYAWEYACILIAGARQVGKFTLGFIERQGNHGSHHS